MKSIVIALISVYQYFLSPLKGPTCRFYPTCSDYAIQAIKKYGVCHGLYRTVIRVLKCHPFHPGGYDPV